MDANDVLALGLGVRAPWKLVGQHLDRDKQPNELRLDVAADRGAPGNRLQRNPDLRERTFDPLDTADPIAFPTAKPGNIIVHRQRSLPPRIQIFDNPNTSREIPLPTQLSPVFPDEP